MDYKKLFQKLSEKRYAGKDIQVLFCILGCTDEKCTNKYIEKTLNIKNSLVCRYIKNLLKENLITRKLIPNDYYNTKDNKINLEYFKNNM